MLRTTIGVSFILVLGGLPACSSKSTDDHNSGGNGTIVGNGGSAGTSTGGTASGGAITNTGGTASGGGTTGACTGTTLTCADAMQAKVCDPTTGLVETFSCVDEAAAQGFVASGCGKDPDTGNDSCLITAVADTACQEGAQAFAHCEGATTDEQLFNIYVNCFQNNMDGHAVITCFNDYVTPAMMTANDCLRAEENCFPAAGGAGPDPGTAGTGGGP
jgi:hypothetical protein